MTNDELQTQVFQLTDRLRREIEEHASTCAKLAATEARTNQLENSYREAAEDCISLSTECDQWREKCIQLEAKNAELEALLAPATEPPTEVTPEFDLVPDEPFQPESD